MSTNTGLNHRGVAVVTGTSSGIGRATALALKNAGYQVFGTSRKQLANFDGVTMLVCDVTDDASVKQMIAQVMAQSGRIDLVVNNAGIGLLAAAEESSVQQAQALFDVNVFGVLRMTHAVLPIMQQQKYGRIINMSSVLGLIPAPYNALYASTKHAVEGYSESLDHEVRTQGIRVTLVEPAITRTAFEENLLQPDQLLPRYQAERQRLEALMRHMMQSGDTPEMVAATVLKAATTKTPKRRYTAGKQAGQVRFLRRFFPEALVDKGLRKFSQLPD